MGQAARLLIGLLAVALGVYAFVWWRGQQKPPPSPPPPAITEVAAPATPPPAPDAGEPGIRHPIESGASQTRPLPGLAESDSYVSKALVDLLGRKSVMSFLALDGFVNRFVATVDNLAGGNPAASRWPVVPMAGHLETESRAAGTVISAKNADRYAAFVRLVDAVDTRRVVALYLRLYPLFQQAYEDLGYPGKYFNDRVVEVIDDLLATPDVAEPIAVRRAEVIGADGSTRPGRLFQFQDPALEERSAGQKILLRLGRDNVQKLKAKLVDIRRRIAKGAAALKVRDK